MCCDRDSLCKSVSSVVPGEKIFAKWCQPSRLVKTLRERWVSRRLNTMPTTELRKNMWFDGKQLRTVCAWAVRPSLRRRYNHAPKRLHETWAPRTSKHSFGVRGQRLRMWREQADGPTPTALEESHNLHHLRTSPRSREGNDKRSSPIVTATGQSAKSQNAQAWSQPSLLEQTSSKAPNMRTCLVIRRRSCPKCKQTLGAWAICWVILADDSR